MTSKVKVGLMTKTALFGRQTCHVACVQLLGTVPSVKKPCTAPAKALIAQAKAQGEIHKRLAGIQALPVELQPGWQVLFKRVLSSASCQATALHNQSVQHTQTPKICWQLPSATGI